jgi:hypothetical protein
MDERQAQIREGAGLEESKLNVEFIEWLRKWSTPMLMVVAVVALGFLLYQRWERAKLAEVDRAFGELDSALTSPNPSPESLKAIADSYEAVRAVPTIARLSAADLYLSTVRTGIKPGAQVKPDGSVDATEVLSDEERSKSLNEAERLYKAVLDKTVGSNATVLHAISAAYGLAAVAESRGDLDKAKSYYEQVQKMADAAGFPEHSKVAKQRIDELPTLKDKPKLYVLSELPKPPEPPAPTGPTGIPGAIGTTGATRGAEAATGATGEPAATGQPAATGAPVPTGAAPVTGAAPATGTPAPTPAPAPAPTGIPAPSPK